MADAYAESQSSIDLVGNILSQMAAPVTAGTVKKNTVGAKNKEVLAKHNTDGSISTNCNSSPDLGHKAPDVAGNNMAAGSRRTDKNVSVVDRNINKSDNSSAQVKSRPSTSNTNRSSHNSRSSSVSSAADNREIKTLKADLKDMKKSLSAIATFREEMNELKETLVGHNCGYFHDYDEEEEEGEVWNELDDDDQVDLSTPELQPPTKRARFDFDTLLDSLASEVNKDEQCGPPIHGKLADIIENLAKGGIAEEKRAEKIKAQHRPKNCPLMTCAYLNTELWDLVQVETRSRDARLQKVEQSMVAGLVPVINLANTMINSVVNNDKLPSRTSMIEMLTDSITLIMSSKHELDMRRRELIRPDLQTEFRGICNPKHPVTEYLFGSDLTQVIKDITETSRVTNKIRNNGQSFRGRGRGSQFSRGRPFTYRGRFLGRSNPRRGRFRGRGKPTSSQQAQRS